MADEKKTTPPETKPKKQVRLAATTKTIQNLVTETRQAFAAAGIELSEESVREHVGQAVKAVWHNYLIKEICESCGLTGLPQIEAEIGEDEEEED